MALIWINTAGQLIRGTNTGNYTPYVHPKLTKPGFIQAKVYQVTNGNIGVGKTQTNALNNKGR